MLSSNNNEINLQFWTERQLPTSFDKIIPRDYQIFQIFEYSFSQSTHDSIRFDSSIDPSSGIIIPEFEGATRIIFVSIRKNSEMKSEEGEEKDENESWI